MTQSNDQASPTYRLRSDEVIMQELDGVTVLLDLRSSLYLELNATATVLLPLLERGAGERVLVEALIEQFGVSVSTAGPDVAAFLAHLWQHGLLTPSLPDAQPRDTEGQPGVVFPKTGAARPGQAG